MNASEGRRQGGSDGAAQGRRARSVRRRLSVGLRCAAIALLVLVAAGVARPRAASPQPRKDAVVARVNGHELRLSDVYASIESLSLGDQIDARDQLGTYIEAMINEEVLFQWALRADFGGDAGLRQEVKDLVVRSLIDRHVRSQIKVTEADARAYYDANPSLVRGEHVRVRRILLPERAQCEEVRARIDSDEAFSEAARRLSLDAETRAQGGDAGLMMRGESPPDSYELEFFAMEVGEMRVFDVPQGCMLVRSVFHVNPPLPPFSAVRAELMHFLRNRQEVNLVERLFKQAGKGSQVERLYSDGRPSADPEAPAAAGARAGTTGGTSR